MLRAPFCRRMSRVEEAERVCVRREVIEGSASAFQVCVEVGQRVRTPDTTVAPIALCAPVRQRPGVQQPDQRRSRHAEKLCRLLRCEIVSAGRPKLGDCSLERFDNVCAEENVASATVDETGFAVEQFRDLIERGGPGWGCRSSHAPDPLTESNESQSPSTYSFDGNAVRHSTNDVSSAGNGTPPSPLLMNRVGAF